MLKRLKEKKEFAGEPAMIMDQLTFYTRLSGKLFLFSVLECVQSKLVFISRRHTHEHSRRHCYQNANFVYHQHFSFVTVKCVCCKMSIRAFMCCVVVLMFTLSSCVGACWVT